MQSVKRKKKEKKKRRQCNVLVRLALTPLHSASMQRAAFAALKGLFFFGLFFAPQ